MNSKRQVKRKVGHVVEIDVNVMLNLCNISRWPTSTSLVVASNFAWHKYIPHCRVDHYLQALSLFLILLSRFVIPTRGGSRIFFRRGCTRLLLYFNTNKPHSFLFFLQNTSCIRKPHVISGGLRTPCTLPLDPPLPTYLHVSLTVFVWGWV